MSFDLVGHLRLVDDMSKPLRNAMGGVLKFGAAAAGLGAAVSAVAIAGNSMKKAMDFESQMSSIQALTGATDKQMQQMQTLALQQGALTKYSALEAAQGIEELLKAGMSTAQVQAGGLNAALNLATAGSLGLAESAEIMSTALNSFKKDGLTAAQAADILAGTANASATDVHDLRYSLAAVGSVADGVGQSFKDTNTALGLFANNGLKGADAGTSLKTMLSNLVPATDKAYGLFEDFNLLTVNTTDALAFMSKKGIKSTGTSVQAVTKDIEKYIAAQTGLKVGTSKAAKETKKFLTASNLIHSAFYDNKGEIKDLAQVADLLKNRFGKLTNEQRQYYLHQIFGSDAIRAGNILFKEGAAGVKKFQQEMANVTALQVAKKKMDNAAGAVEQFHGAIETLQISALLPTMPIIKDLANAAAEFTAKYTPQITAGIKRAVTYARDYLNKNFINNPEFQKLPTLQSKVDFTFGKLKELFDVWWNNGGQKQTHDVAENVTRFMLDTFEAAVPRMAQIGLKLGWALASGILDGLDPLKQAEEHLGNQDWLNNFFDASNKYLPEFMGGVPDSQLESHNAQRRAALGNTNGTPTSMLASPIQTVKDATSSPFKNATGRAGGLDRVPYNNMPIRAHKDEAVLTKHEASEWRDQQRGGGSGGVVINMYGTTIREDADIDKLARQLAVQLAR
ncbi:phage tail tape measure protein [Paenibacillus peoriae]|uniref:phage tail tape measure protein n=1 Tax=Paenibacillus peoriae TaxID=59893 RepID=UPI003F9AD42A